IIRLAGELTAAATLTTVRGNRTSVVTVTGDTSADRARATRADITPIRAQAITTAIESMASVVEKQISLSAISFIDTDSQCLCGSGLGQGTDVVKSKVLS